MPGNQNIYPPVSFYFKLMVQGVNEEGEARFENVSGLDAKIETEPIVEGGENQFSRKLPKALQYSNLILKRGLLIGSPLMEWISQAVESFKFSPKQVNVILMNEKEEALVNWVFFNAYPLAVKVSDVNSTENKYAIETLELAYDYFKREDKK
jgi:phage tail-like protein